MITINATGDTTLHTAGKYCAEDILVKVPAGGSSGGASVETCTVRLICTRRRIRGYTYTKVADGVISMENTGYTDRSNALDVTLTDVLCGSFISVITTITQGLFGIEISGNATSEIAPSVDSACTSVAIVAPMDAGSYSEVTMIDND